jgi:A/G-specific adenine glycosylase
VGAVLSIAHDARLPILDGNVARVLSRLFRVSGDVKATPQQRRLWSLAEAALPRERCGDFNQALMELGALVCRPSSPSCVECPLRAHCQAAAAGDPTAYPEAQKRRAVPTSQRVSLLLSRPDGRFLIEQRPGEGLLASMWELPSAEVSRRGAKARAEVARALARERGARGVPRPRGTAEHRFSHRHWVIHGFAATTRARGAITRGTWVDEAELAEFGVPTVTRKALAAAREEI